MAPAVLQAEFTVRGASQNIAHPLDFAHFVDQPATTSP